MLERDRALQETNYTSFSKSLKQAQIDEALGTTLGTIPNIAVVQQATPPKRPPLKDSNRLKLSGAAAAGGIAGGIALALFLGLFVDQSVKRPIEVEQRLRLPLFGAIPSFALSRRIKRRRLRRPKGRKTATDEATVALAKHQSRNGADPTLYWEAIRDRLILHFEIHKLTHKPKLVAVTSCSPGAGVSTAATGLAQALSATGDGKVLLVDMNPAAGPTMHAFLEGVPQGTIADALEAEKREATQVDNNLYMVSAREVNGNKVGIIPRRFASLVPRMKASDYDFIIFDMPPVSQTSPTAKVTGLMDMVFMVVESGKTNLERAKRANMLLAESGANVAVLLNKYQSPLPRRLQTDL
jgi:tyrosine-protein kinase Etk/Wzc